MSVHNKSMRLLSWPQLEKLVPYTRQHLSRLEKLDRFPRRIMLGERRVAWLEDEVRAWVEARAAEREAA